MTLILLLFLEIIYLRDIPFYYFVIMQKISSKKLHVISFKRLFVVVLKDL